MMGIVVPCVSRTSKTKAHRIIEGIRATLCDVDLTQILNGGEQYVSEAFALSLCLSGITKDALDEWPKQYESGTLQAPYL
jgi:hypothetical protein